MGRILLGGKLAVKTVLKCFPGSEGFIPAPKITKIVVYAMRLQPDAPTSSGMTR